MIFGEKSRSFAGGSVAEGWGAADADPWHVWLVLDVSAGRPDFWHALRASSLD